MSSIPSAIALESFVIYGICFEILRFLFPVLALTVCAVAAPQTVPAPESTVGIFGRVVNSETRQPVRRAAIRVFTSRNEWFELTDGDGRFRFPALQPGEYGLIAHRDGYTDQSYKVERSDFDKQKELPIVLPPQGVITGKIVDALGQPLPSAQVQALGSRTPGGKLDALSSTETDDLGEYRLSGLDPQRYRVRVTYRDGRRSEFDPTPLTTATSYYGGPEKPAEITVKAGSVTAGIDFVLNPVRPVTIRGTLRAETGALSERAVLWIVGNAGEGGHNADGKNGKFEIADVSPGSYTIAGETLNEAAPLFGTVVVEVRGADLDGIDLVLRPIPRIDGEFRIEGDVVGDPKLSRIFFSAIDRLIPMTSKIGRPGNDRKFTVALIPGEYNITFEESISNFAIRQVTLDNKPVTNWKLRIDDSPETKKLVIVLKPKERP